MNVVGLLTLPPKSVSILNHLSNRVSQDKNNIFYRILWYNFGSKSQARCALRLCCSSHIYSPVFTLLEPSLESNKLPQMYICRVILIFLVVSSIPSIPDAAKHYQHQHGRFKNEEKFLGIVILRDPDDTIG